MLCAGKRLFSPSDGVSFFFILWSWGLNLRPGWESRTLPLCRSSMPCLLSKLQDVPVRSVQTRFGSLHPPPVYSVPLSLPHGLDDGILESDSQSSSAIPGLIVSP